MTVHIRAEETPNPQARRYILDRPVQEGSKGRFFRSPEETDEPLAKALFDLDGVQGVMFLPNSVTVNKGDAHSWETLEPRVQEAIRGYFE